MATERLASRAGTVVVFEAPPLAGFGGWPLPGAVRPDAFLDVGPVHWLVTPAGLLERLPDVSAHPASESDARRPAEVRIKMRPGAPWGHVRSLAAGDASVFEVEGDAQAVVDVRWVLDHVRWDAAGDLTRMLPETLRAPLTKLADVLVDGVRGGARAVGAWWPRAGWPPSSR